MLCEKPLTTTLDEARRLHATVALRTSTPFVVAYTYTGFADGHARPELVHQRRDRRDPQGRGVVSAGLAGHQARSRKPEAGRPGGSIRPRPGGSGCGGDIGTHAYEFVRFVAGRRPPGFAARLKTFVPGRALDDDFTVLAELDNGGIATITASQVTIGAQNDNGFRVIGTTGTLEWSITDHTVLKHYTGGQPLKLYRQGAEYGYFPGVDQALSAAAVGPSRRLSRGARQPAPDARMDHPRQPGRDASPSRSNTRHRRRRRGHGVHRGRRRQFAARWRVGRNAQDRLNQDRPMKDPLVRFSVAIGGELLQKFDQYREEHRYPEPERGGSRPDARGP